MILALGVILGINAVSGFVLLREMMHTGYGTAEMPARYSGLTEKEQVPKIPARQRESVIDDCRLRYGTCYGN